VPEDNKAIVQRFFDEVCNERKLDVAGELFSEDHSYHDPSTPDAGPGPEGQKQLVSLYQGAFSDAGTSGTRSA
jgi:ketosteroid isomerase-like protein